MIMEIMVTFNNNTIETVTWGRTYHCGWCYLFTVSILGLFSFTLPCMTFPVSISAEKGSLSSSCDLELWLLTLTYEVDLDKIKMTHQCSPCQISRSKVISFDNCRVDTQTDCSTCRFRTTKWSVTLAVSYTCLWTSATPKNRLISVCVCVCVCVAGGVHRTPRTGRCFRLVVRHGWLQRLMRCWSLPAVDCCLTPSSQTRSTTSNVVHWSPAQSSRETVVQNDSRFHRRRLRLLQADTRNCTCQHTKCK